MTDTMLDIVECDRGVMLTLWCVIGGIKPTTSAPLVAIGTPGDRGGPNGQTRDGPGPHDEPYLTEIHPVRFNLHSPMSFSKGPAT